MSTGRTRVRSRIQYVLIVTKARDNRLINLTRELAIYLMQKKPISSPDNASRSEPNERGMVVYVDAQLRASKRFDAGGIQRDYPQFFQPVSRRRSSSSTSISTLSAYPSSSNMADAVKRRDDGQLRYWTAEMCSSSPQLFDFVVTVSPSLAIPSSSLINLAWWRRHCSVYILALVRKTMIQA